MGSTHITASADVLQLDLLAFIGVLLVVGHLPDFVH